MRKIVDGWVGGWGILGDCGGGCSINRHVGVSWVRGRPPTTHVSDTCKQVRVIFMIISGRQLSGWLEPIKSVGNHCRNSWTTTPQQTTICKTIGSPPGPGRPFYHTDFRTGRKAEESFLFPFRCPESVRNIYFPSSLYPTWRPVTSLANLITCSYRIKRRAKRVHSPGSNRNEPANGISAKWWKTNQSCANWRESTHL